jgi:quinol monooxygenase YgiN
MILVTGSILARPDCVDAALALSLEHVHRSRGEPGCLAHGVHRDAECPQRLVFVEQWADQAALAAHFAVPASRAFVAAVAALAAEPPRIAVYDATPIRMGGKPA